MLRSPQSTDVWKEPASESRGLTDWICLSAFLAMMGVYTYFHSRQRMFWGDELMGWMVMREQTFSGMMHAWWAGLDSGSLFFMVFGRWWMGLISPSELSLRAFSAVATAASFVCVWFTARRYYSLGIVAFCVPAIFLFHKTLTWQFSNGRMYGGFMLGSALVVYAFTRSDPALPLRRRVLWLTFSAHLFLLSSHILGPLYSGAFIAALVAQDLYARKFRPALYLSAFAAWPILLLTYKNTIGTMALGKPKYWTVQPSFRDIPNGFSVYDNRLKFLLAVLLAAAALAWMVSKVRQPAARGEGASSRRPVYFVFLTFTGIILLSWAVSRTGNSIFFSRYLLPVTIGDALLLCEIFRRIMRGVAHIPLLRYGIPAAAAVLFVQQYVQHARHPYDLPYANYTADLVARDGGLPLVITDYNMFAEMQFYQHDHATILMFVDWPIVLAPDFGPGGAAGPHEMDNWKARGYYSDRILPTQELLARYPRFLVVNEASHTSWFRHYLQNNPQYRVVRQPSFRGDDVWLVEKLPGAAQVQASVRRPD